MPPSPICVNDAISGTEPCSRHGLPGPNCWSAARVLRHTLAVAILVSTSWAVQSQKPELDGQGSSAPVTADTGNPTGQATQATQPPLVHIVPFGRIVGLKNTFAPAGAHLTYWGGPVISQVHVVAVFWGPDVNTAVTAPGAIDQFFTDITQSQYFDLASEYSTAGITGSGSPATSSNQSIARGTFDSKFTITPVLCGTAGTCSLTDAQIQTELLRQLVNGGLPQPVADAQGQTNTFYMIYFPTGVSISVGGINSCVSGGFCAYHSNTTSRLIPYGVEPDFAASGCSTGCGTGTLFQNITAVTSHELIEAVTDPLVGSATTTAAPLGWYDPDPLANPLGEIADICGGQDVIVSANGHAYSVQQEFSNLQNDCISAPPIFNMSAPASASSSTSFNLTLTVQQSATAAALANYTGTVHFTSSDSAAVLPADYTFTAADAGVHTFAVTLNTSGTQSVTVTDAHSSGFNGTSNIIVNGHPDLTITKTHTGNFTQGLSGSYTITVSNAGLAASSGTVTVVDSLPAGLTASAMVGNGWTCILATATCTRTDALAAGSSYPAITLPVSIAANAPASLTNVVTVSGGNESNTANNSASDVTQILVPQTDLQTTLTLPAGNFIQGQTGASYTVVVANLGTVSSSGTVTVTNSLPAGLTATAIGGPGWNCTLASVTCSRTDALAINTGFSAITLTFNIDNNAPSGVTVSSTVSGGGDLSPANNTASQFFNITPMINIVPTVVQATATAGQPAAFSFTVDPAATAGTVSFSCSGLPVGTACAFNPASVTSSGSVSLTVTTTARTATTLGPSRNAPWLLPGVLATLLVLGLIATFPAHKRLRPAFVLAGILLAAVLSGCGGGGGQQTQTFQPTPTPNPNATPAGTYQFAMKATGSSAGTTTQFFILVVK